jgi:alcohol dehydrogenase class IV
MTAQGVSQGLYRQYAIERVVHGVPAEKAVPAEAERLGAAKVFIVSTRSLARNTDAVQKIAAGLGARFAGSFDEVPAHTPREAVIAGAAAARAAGADLMVPRTVILDPAITVHTPMRLFLGTGIRAVDHAVERLCSLIRHPFSDATAVEALRLLNRGLPAVQKDPGNLAARLDCQLGAWMSIFGGMAGVPVGASHGIGHVLGAHAGVPHGETSCVMLPSVMQWNRGVNFEEQLRVAHAFERTDDDAAGAVRDLIASLGLPTRLRDVGVKREDFQVIAEKSMHDLAVKTNPRPIEKPADVVEILELAW